MTIVCYTGIVFLLFTVLIELEHLCSTTFHSMEPHKIQDAELHFIMHDFFFNEQMNPFFFFFQPLALKYSGCWPPTPSPSPSCS